MKYSDFIDLTRNKIQRQQSGSWIYVPFYREKKKNINRQNMILLNEKLNRRARIVAFINRNKFLFFLIFSVEVKRFFQFYSKTANSEYTNISSQEISWVVTIASVGSLSVALVFRSLGNN